MNDVQLPIDDSIYKRLYSFARMVEDLLRSIFAEANLTRPRESIARRPVGGWVRLPPNVAHPAEEPKTAA